MGTSGRNDDSGLVTSDTSYSLSTLTKESSVSTNNQGGRNDNNEDGTIETVNSFLKE